MFVALRRALSLRLIATLSHLFGELGSWRDPDAARFLVQAVPLVQASQRTLGTFTAQHVAFQASKALDTVIPPISVPDVRVVNLRPPDEVYHRPFVTVYKNLAQGADITAAVGKGQTRLAQVAEADLQQTYAQASQAAMETLPKDATPSGWHRTLQGPVNCPKCVVASTQLFTVATLNPLHPQCDCTVDPVFGSELPADPEREAQVRAAITALTGKPDLSPAELHDLVSSMVAEHGELGPMLVRPNDHFATKADLPS
jgi:hypothetical protein